MSAQVLIRRKLRYVGDHLSSVQATMTERADALTPEDLQAVRSAATQARQAAQELDEIAGILQALGLKE